MAKDYIAKPTRKRAPAFKQELKVLLVLAVFIVGLEATARYFAPDLDYDRKHISEFPEIVQSFEETHQASDAKAKVLFYGNSLMMHGADIEVLNKRFDEAGVATTTKVTPVGTAITDWTYLYQRYFEDTEVHPDILVVGFVGSHISDDYKLKIRRLGRHFVAQEDLPEIWDKDLTDFHSRAQTSLSHYSALIGDQPEHQLNMLYWMMDEYRGGVRLNNSFVEGYYSRKAEKKQTVEELTPFTFTRLKRFIELTKKHKVQVWFVPMPQPEFYEIDQQAIDLIQNSGMQWVDARSIEGMTPEDFSDGYHLGETGKAKFAKWIGDQLEGHLKK